jgi:HK97 gp10 family phage protein
VAARAALDVVGLKELEQALAQLPAAFRRPVVLAALKKSARPVVSQARALAARGKDPKRRGSKKQRRSKQSERIGPGADSIAARAVRDKERPSVVTVAVGTDAAHWYMRFIEFGTSRQRKAPFLRPAFDGNADKLPVAYGEEVWREISKTAARLAKQAERGKLSPRAVKALSS